jgi:hypothetical protein
MVKLVAFKAIILLNFVQTVSRSPPWTSIRLIGDDSSSLLLRGLDSHLLISYPTWI